MGQFLKDPVGLHLCVLRAQAPGDMRGACSRSSVEIFSIFLLLGLRLKRSASRKRGTAHRRKSPADPSRSCFWSEVMLKPKPPPTSTSKGRVGSPAGGQLFGRVDLVPFLGSSS